MKNENRPVKLGFKLAFLKDDIPALQGIKLQEFIRMLAKNYNGKICYVGSDTYVDDMRVIFSMENKDCLIFSMKDLILETCFGSKEKVEHFRLAIENTSSEFQNIKQIKCL